MKKETKTRLLEVGFSALLTLIGVTALEYFTGDSMLPASGVIFFFMIYFGIKSA